MSEDIAVGTCRVIKVEEYSLDGVKDTRSIAEFPDKKKLLTQDSYDSSKLVVKAELKYGKIYDIIFREHVEETAPKSGRKFREESE